MTEFSFRSDLTIEPSAFWSRMSMRAVNEELAPLVRMTVPAAWATCSLAQWQTGRVLFRSWILLFGIFPVDRQAVQMERIHDETGFLERSSSWMNRLWEHERTTEITPGGCVLVDRVKVLGRIPLAERLLTPTYKRIFEHRHQRLRALYGRTTSMAGGS